MGTMAKSPAISDLSLLVAANVRALIAYHQQSINAFCRSRGLVQTTVNRLVSGKMNPTATVIADIANAVGLQPWQLLVPDLDPRNPPVLRTISPAEADLYRKLAEALQNLSKN